MSEFDIPQLHRRSVEWFDSCVHGIRDDHWSRPTPCSDWDVRELVNHVVNEDRWTPELFAGKTIEEVGDRFDGDLLGDDPLGAWEEARKEAVNAVQAEGAMERTVHVSWGEISGANYAGQLFTDHLIHGWDLAKATGQDTNLDPELVEACYRMSKPIEDTLKASGAFGEKIEPPEGADRQTELLAVFGRKP